ncbi:MAG: Stk1 family PASTA domain-containing Ser/Thr kinase [Micropruina sp.]
MTDPLVGHVLDGRYVIQRKLARGGMATVYLANDTRLTRVVAVKVMHEGLGDDQDFVSKFDREARAAAKLAHPNVVAVFDQGVDRGRPFIVMEYVEGCTLRHLITREAPFEPSRALDLLLPVADALAAAHEAGLIHRDIKPENVLISDRGQVKVADFGLAKAVSAQTATATGLLIGTVSYIAPELVTHGKADPRCDVYALGVVLYEMLTGKKPHTGESPIQVAYSHVHNPIPTPSSTHKASWRESRTAIPPYLDALVTTAAARQPALRPENGRVLFEHLRQAREALGKGVMDDPALTARMRQTQLDPDALLTEHIPPIPAGTPSRTATLRFTPSTPLSPGFPQTPDGLPYYDDDPGVPAPRVSPPPVRRRRGIAVLLLVFLLTMGLGYGVWYFAAGRFTTVPDLRGMTQSQATAAGLTNGVRVAFDNEYSENVPSGQIVRTDPLTGERMLSGGELRAFVSRGPERYPVPTMAGMTQAAASAALSAARLTLGDVEQEFHDKVEAGDVISSSIKAGTPVKPGTVVDLKVSKGPAPVDLVDWTGKKYTEAKAALTELGLVVKKSEDAFSDTVAKGLIITQTPAAGQVFRADTVTFQVSKGPSMIEIPNVRGLTVDAATAELKKAGFKVSVKRLINFGFGRVAYTTPGSGTKAAPGSTVIINVA